MYTEMIKAMEQRGPSITHALGKRYENPPKRYPLPSARLLFHAFSLDSADRYSDYYTQIMSVFGEVLKMDCTKKVILPFIYN